MKNILLLATLCLLFFNACKYPITISSYSNTPEEVIINSAEKISEFETYIVENTEKRYDTTQIFNGRYYTELENSSFEQDIPRYSRVPINWVNCGDVHSSLVDIHGYREKYFQVSQKANHGKNFVGMITRNDGTFEAIGQYLNNSLDAGYTYSFSLFVCRSQQYMSMSRLTRKVENFNKPAVLQIYGGKDCNNSNLLISTTTIEHTNWAEYVFVFDVEEEVEFILIEAYYDNLAAFSYDGNLLIDNISPIYKISK
jgi:hypothetical protein